MSVGRSTRRRSRSATALSGVIAGALATATGPADATPSTGSEAPEVPSGTMVAPPIDCRPSTVRPFPVIVLPGADGTTDDTARQWSTMTSTLEDRGACTLTFQGGVLGGKRWAGDMPAAAGQLGRFVADVRATTGADKVDIVAHSAGSFVTNYFLKALGGAADVNSVVFLAPEARGCDGAGLLAQYGLGNLPVTPVQVLQAAPWLLPVLTGLMPEMAPAMQLSPVSTTRVCGRAPTPRPGSRNSCTASPGFRRPDGPRPRRRTRPGCGRSG